VLNANGAEFAVAEHREAAELIVRSVNRAAPKKADRPRRVREPSVREPRVSKASALDEAAARGVMPEKPVIKSPTNQHYQKRFDKLAELAAADDWEAIAGYEVRGNNTYAKDLARYRDRLLAAHAAAQPA
jgi:hypothetical protein